MEQIPKGLQGLLDCMATLDRIVGPMAPPVPTPEELSADEKFLNDLGIGGKDPR